MADPIKTVSFMNRVIVGKKSGALNLGKNLYKEGGHVHYNGHSKRFAALTSFANTVKSALSISTTRASAKAAGERLPSALTSKGSYSGSGARALATFKKRMAKNRIPPGASMQQIARGQRASLR